MAGRGGWSELMLRSLCFARCMLSGRVVTALASLCPLRVVVRLASCTARLADVDVGHRVGACVDTRVECECECECDTCDAAVPGRVGVDAAGVRWYGSPTRNTAPCAVTNEKNSAHAMGTHARCLLASGTASYSFGSTVRSSFPTRMIELCCKGGVAKGYKAEQIGG